MAISDLRREELMYASDRYGTQAAELHLDGLHREALDASDHAVRATRELLQADPGDARVADTLAARLRDRAETQRELGLWLQGTDMAAAKTQYRLGIADATEAIEWYERDVDSQPALLVPSLRLLVAEFESAVGDRSGAAQRAESLMDRYRAAASSGDEHVELELAHALSRCAKVLDTSGARDRAAQARRESVAAYRPHARPGGWLWSTRLSRGTAWVTTPDAARLRADGVPVRARPETVGQDGRGGAVRPPRRRGGVRRAPAVGRRPVARSRRCRQPLARAGDRGPATAVAVGHRGPRTGCRVHGDGGALRRVCHDAQVVGGGGGAGGVLRARARAASPARGRARRPGRPALAPVVVDPLSAAWGVPEAMPGEPGAHVHCPLACGVMARGTRRREERERWDGAPTWSGG